MTLTVSQPSIKYSRFSEERPRFCPGRSSIPYHRRRRGRMGMTNENPTTGDLVCFLGDQTICRVIGSIPSNPPIYGLKHPQHGHILVRRYMIFFPIQPNAEMPDVPPKVLCINCRWFKEIRHPAARGVPDAPLVASCRNPTFMVGGEKDYVTGELVPEDPYVRNSDGLCQGFEYPPMKDIPS